MNEKLKNDITIFTPTFNRKKILSRLYKSLCCQTVKNFVWVIIDDGSTDETYDLIKNFKEEELIPIEYHYQENSGKMSAHNLAVKLCKTKYFFCVDSDDYLPNHCIEYLYNNVKNIENDDSIAGFIGYKCVSNSKKDLITEFPNLKDSTIQDLYYNGFKGETSLVFKTKVIKEYMFPNIEKENFITEAYLYDQIDRKYQFYLLPEILTIYEYQIDGLTSSINKLIEKNPKGFALFWGQRYKFQMEEKKVNRALISGINYIEFSIYSKTKYSKYTMKEKMFLAIVFPLGLLKYKILLNNLNKERRKKDE